MPNQTEETKRAIMDSLGEGGGVEANKSWLP